MANLPEQPTYDAGVYQLENTDPVQGHDSVSGNLGVSNQPLLNLANRTAYLNQTLTSILNGGVIPPTVAPLDSPDFTGTPRAPTPELGDNSTAIATTAFVQGTANGLAAISVAGNANVTLSQAQYGCAILYLTGALTGDIALIFPTQSGRWIVFNNTTGAFTLVCKTAAGAGIAVAQGDTQELFVNGTGGAIIQTRTDFTSIALTGSSTFSPTPSPGDSSNSLANTNFVMTAFGGLVTKALSNVNVQLTTSDTGHAVLVLQGALTANITVTWPSSDTGEWVVHNQTTGAFSVTLSTPTASGADVVLPQGQAVVVYSNGTDLFLAGAAANSSFNRYSFTATLGQATFNAPYTVGNLIVFVNGAAQAPGDITASDSATVTLTGYNGGNGCFANDDVQVVAFNSFTVADAVTVAGGTMEGPLQLATGSTMATEGELFTSDETIATTSYVQRVGIKAASQVNLPNGTYTMAITNVGESVVLTGTNTCVVTLADSSQIWAGWRNTFTNVSTGTLTLVCATGQNIQFTGNAGGLVTQVILLPGDTLTLEATDDARGAYWTAVDGTATANYSTTIQQKIGSRSGIYTVSASQTLPLSYVGGYIYATANCTLTLPDSGSLPPGASYYIQANANATVVVTNSQPFGGPNGNGTTTIKLDSAVAAEFINFGSNWISVGGSGQVSLFPGGYQKFSSGLILQWGGGNGIAGGHATIPFAIAFPTACFVVTATALNPEAYCATLAAVPSTTEVLISAWSIGSAPAQATAAFNWMATGY